VVALKAACVPHPALLPYYRGKTGSTNEAGLILMCWLTDYDIVEPLGILINKWIEETQSGFPISNSLIRQESNYGGKNSGAVGSRLVGVDDDLLKNEVRSRDGGYVWHCVLLSVAFVKSAVNKRRTSAPRHVEGSVIRVARESEVPFDRRVLICWPFEEGGESASAKFECCFLAFVDVEFAPADCSHTTSFVD
jgi:hypothetical protein